VLLGGISLDFVLVGSTQFNSHQKVGSEFNLPESHPQKKETIQKEKRSKENRNGDH